MTSRCLTWVDGHFCAAHRAIEGGRLHGHTWRVRVYWPADGTNALVHQQNLRQFLMIFDHDELEPHFSRAEDIAAYIGRAIVGSPEMVDVWREPEGLGARWQR